MVTVQAAGCAPIVKAFRERRANAEEFPHPHTIASGLRVPRAIGDFLMLDILRRSQGAAIAVTDEEILAAVKEIATTEGIFVAPEGAACLPALRRLLNEEKIASHERIVMFNTASGFKYLDLL
jgi:threonine synthase